MIVSILSMLFMLVLFVSEFGAYITEETNSEMYIDVNRGSEKVNPFLACLNLG